MQNKGKLSWTPDKSPYVWSDNPEQQKAIDDMSPYYRRQLADMLAEKAMGYILYANCDPIKILNTTWRVDWFTIRLNQSDFETVRQYAAKVAPVSGWEVRAGVNKHFAIR